MDIIKRSVPGFISGASSPSKVVLTDGTHTATLKFPDATDGGAFSQSELLLSNSVSGQNVITLLNSSSSGFSAITVRGSDNVEHMAFGYANSGSGYVAAGGPFTEWSSFNNNTGDRASFTGAISGTTLTTSAPTGTIAIGQLISDVSSGNNITAGTVITAGSGSSWTVNNSQTVASRAMTSGLPVPKAWFVRSGFYPSTGTYRTGAAAYVENYLGTDGRWVWPTIDGSPSTATFLIDPTNDFVTVNSKLLVGNLNLSLTPVAAIDNFGHLIVGSSGGGSRATDGTFVINTAEATANQLRLINANSFKTDFLLNTGGVGNRLDIRNTDNSNVIVLSLYMNGTGTVVAGGPLYSTSTSFLIGTKASLTAGGTGNVPTLTAGPVTGNPTKWVPIDDNGTTRYIPAW